MAQREKWAIGLLALIVALMLSMAAATAVAYNQSTAPLPTQVSLSDFADDGGVAPIRPTATRVDPAAGLVRLPPLTLVWTPTPQSESLDPELPPEYQRADYGFSIGQSVQGRDILGEAFPITNSPRGLVLVNGIHGDEVWAWPVVQTLITKLQSQTLAQPETLSLYFIEALNPDGAAAEKRVNANKIDLNRNWDTYDWRTGIETSAFDYLPVGGGPRPFSEPETQAMRNFLIALKETHLEGVTVIYLHAAAPPDGYVGPGTHRVNGQDLADSASREIGQLFADVTGYRYANTWIGGYTVTGDASTWAVAQGMRSLTIELPTRAELDAAQAQTLLEGLWAIIEHIGAGP